MYKQNKICFHDLLPICLNTICFFTIQITIESSIGFSHKLILHHCRSAIQFTTSNCFCSVPFELYNDSAEAVLKFFRKQHLYDELEAEVSLGFEQLMHWIHTHVFENAIERALFEFALSTTTSALKAAARAKKIGEFRITLQVPLPIQFQL